MPRTARIQSETDCYHVIQRGTNKQDIFLDDGDRRLFLKMMKGELSKVDGSVFAWVLMDNHVHLLIRVSFVRLSEFAKNLFSQYAHAFNMRHNRVGALFQGRFTSIPVVSDEQFLATVRYIHQNPLKAGLSKTCDYHWSSFVEYVGESWIVECGRALDMLGGEDGFMSFHIQDGESRYRELFEGGSSRRRRQVIELFEQGYSPQQIQDRTGLARSTVFRILSQR